MKRMALLLVILTTTVSLDASGIYEMRSRWTAKAHNKQAFDVVQVDRLSDTAGKAAFLVTQGNDRYLILDVADYGARKLSRTVRNVATGDYLQVTIHYRFAASTRTEFIAAAKANKDEHELLFQSNRGQFVARESQLYTEDTRKALMGIVPPQFAAELRRLQSDLLGHVNLQIVCRQLVTPLTGGRCERQSAPIVQGAKPDCDVDASFGFPCSAGQRTRSSSAAVHVSMPTRY